jgi:phospholipase C
MAAVVLLVGLIAAPVYFTDTTAAAPAATLNPNQLGFMDHIDHIVFVVLENHAFDNEYGTYCQSIGPHCATVVNGLPPGTCVPVNASQPSGACIRPWNFTQANWTLHTPLTHSYASSHEAWNNGSMNDFYAAEDSGRDPFGHYNGSTVPIYWDLAEEFGLQEDFFSSVLSYSLPNHWHLVAGQAPPVILVNGTLGSPLVAPQHTIQTDRLYLNQSNSTRSIEDLLAKRNVSWTYYDYTLGTYSAATSIRLNANQTRILSTGVAYNTWNPQAAKAESYNASFVKHFDLNTQFYADARNGTLPDLSWVIPAAQDSDHPSQNDTLAQGWLASIVDAVEASPDWNSTALYITFDEYGGFYDHVDPPVFQGQQLGFRVPLLIVSPYTRAGAVINSMGYFESILRLMEWRFHLGCLSTLDCDAPLPIWGFNWNQTPRAPIDFPTNISQASYPFNPNWNAAGGLRTGEYVPPTEFTYFPKGEGPNID